MRPTILTGLFILTVTSCKSLRNTTDSSAPGLTGSLAGYYVQSFAGANSHFYLIEFTDGRYSGKYGEHINGEETEVILKKVVADEKARTMSFKERRYRTTVRITDSGMYDGDEFMYRRLR